MWRLSNQLINQYLFANAITSKQQKSGRLPEQATKLATLDRKTDITVHITTQNKRILKVGHDTTTQQKLGK